jgi:hypothetical protein
MPKCSRCLAQIEPGAIDVPQKLLIAGRWMAPLWRRGQKRLPHADAWEYASGWARVTKTRRWLCPACSEKHI